MSNQQILPIDQEFQSCWRKDDLKKPETSSRRIFELFFLWERMDVGNRHMINLKNLKTQHTLSAYYFCKIFKKN